MKRLILIIALLTSSALNASAMSLMHGNAYFGCREVLSGEYEDGASYYRAIQIKILRPLYARSETVGLAKFLSSALVSVGNVKVDAQLCENIRAAN